MAVSGQFVVSAVRRRHRLVFVASGQGPWPQADPVAEHLAASILQQDNGEGLRDDRAKCGN